MFTFQGSQGLARRLLVLFCWLSAGALSGCKPADVPSRQSSSSATALAEPDVDAYTIPRQPEWTDKYPHADPPADLRYFRIQKLMQDFGLSRFWAVELQAHYRERTRAGIAPGSAFRAALAAARAQKPRRSIDVGKLASAPFIVVFDLDETLFQRSPAYKTGSRGAGWRDFSFQVRDDESFVKLRPGWEQAIQRVHELGGMVILFSAAADDYVEALASQWAANGKNIRELVDGLLGWSHLVLQEKTDGEPIIIPSKDLRLLDESLSRVIIIDDNPVRVVQHHRHRLIKKFQADAYLAARNEGHGLAAPYEQALPFVVKEIEESLAYSKSNHVPFAQAFLPYTMLGQVAMESLTQTSMPPDQARRYIRENPRFVDEKF